MENHFLEINLISAQGLKPVNGRRLQTYAIAWVDPSTKLRTRVDRVGGENPTWNDKFIFRVSDAFLASDTAAVVVHIYAVGYIKDSLIGTVRFLISNCLPSTPSSSFSSSAAAAASSVDPESSNAAAVPAFTAVQIRRPSGRFHGVLNIGAMVIDGSDYSALAGEGTAAIGYRDLMGESFRRRGLRRECREKSEQLSGGESFDGSSCGGDSAEFSDGGDSTASSSSSSTTALKEWNGIREAMRLDGPGLLCGLALQRKIQLGPSDQSSRCFPGSENRKR